MTIPQPAKRLTLWLALTLAGCGGSSDGSGNVTPTVDARLASLGEQLFNDPELSADGTKSCQSCHTSSATAFSDAPNRLSAGVTPSGASTPNLTTRNSPALAYATFIPALKLIDGDWIGGLFHDGRADSLAQQIHDPLVGAREMGNGTLANVIARLRSSATQVDGKTSAQAFVAYFGNGSLPDPATASATDIQAAFDRVGLAMAAFERLPSISPFTSKFDYYLANKASLSAQEQRGYALFLRSDKGNCAACHPVSRSNAAGQPLFTDFSYDNLGVPTQAGDAVDPGLYQTVLNRGTDDPALKGKFRVPTLRNLGKSAPYMHNGAFTTLEQVVNFYNGRDSKSLATDYPGTVNKTELGNLGLTPDEVLDIVAFLKTLDDGYTP